MSKVSIETLKGYFQRKSQPTERHFHDLIDTLDGSELDNNLFVVTNWDDWVTALEAEKENKIIFYAQNETTPLGPIGNDRNEIFVYGENHIYSGERISGPDAAGAGLQFSFAAETVLYKKSTESLTGALYFYAKTVDIFNANGAYPRFYINVYVRNLSLSSFSAQDPVVNDGASIIWQTVTDLSQPTFGPNFWWCDINGSSSVDEKTITKNSNDELSLALDDTVHGTVLYVDPQDRLRKVVNYPQEGMFLSNNLTPHGFIEPGWKRVDSNEVRNRSEVVAGDSVTDAIDALKADIESIPSSDNDKVAVDGSSIAGYLEDVLVAGTNTTITNNNDGTLTINSSEDDRLEHLYVVSNEEEFRSALSAGLEPNKPRLIVCQQDRIEFRDSSPLQCGYGGVITIFAPMGLGFIRRDSASWFGYGPASVVRVFGDIHLPKNLDAPALVTFERLYLTCRRLVSDSVYNSVSILQGSAVIAEVVVGSVEMASGSVEIAIQNWIDDELSDHEGRISALEASPANVYWVETEEEFIAALEAETVPPAGGTVKVIHSKLSHLTVSNAVQWVAGQVHIFIEYLDFTGSNVGSTTRFNPKSGYTNPRAKIYHHGVSCNWSANAYVGTDIYCNMTNFEVYSASYIYAPRCVTSTNSAYRDLPVSSAPQEHFTYNWSSHPLRRYNVNRYVHNQASADTVGNASSFSLIGGIIKHRTSASSNYNFVTSSDWMNDGKLSMGATVDLATVNSADTTNYNRLLWNQGSVPTNVFFNGAGKTAGKSIPLCRDGEMLRGEFVYHGRGRNTSDFYWNYYPRSHQFDQYTVWDMQSDRRHLVSGSKGIISHGGDNLFGAQRFDLDEASKVVVCSSFAGDFVDDTGLVWTTENTPKIVNNQLLLSTDDYLINNNSTGAYLHTTISDDRLSFGTGDFTIEFDFFLNRDSSDAYNVIKHRLLTLGGNTDDGARFQFILRGNKQGIGFKGAEFGFVNSTDGVESIHAISIDSDKLFKQWVRARIWRDGNSLNMTCTLMKAATTLTATSVNIADFDHAFVNPKELFVGSNTTNAETTEQQRWRGGIKNLTVTKGAVVQNGISPSIAVQTSRKMSSLESRLEALENA